MTVLKNKHTVDDIWPMSKKKVLMRVDFNVPIKNGTISNDYRIRCTLPTIRRVIDQGGIVILMSHLGRPKGIKADEVSGNKEKKRLALQTWALEAGTGKTVFFALLQGSEKKKVLSWSSAADKAAELSEEEGNGKTFLFSTLPENEKRKLLDKLTAERRQETHFPQLRQYRGFEEELSLKPVAQRLLELLNDDTDPNKRTRVLFAEDCLDAQKYVNELEAGHVLLLENVRFYSDEGSKNEKERMNMARVIASYGDYYVSDAFGTAHRDSATMTDIPRVLGHGAAGYLMATEISAFANVLGDPPRPMVAIVGGAKVSDKILLLENMLSKIDRLIIGGAMAYTFLKAQGVSIGKSFHQAGQSFTDQYGETRDIDDLAASLLEKAKANGIEVALPIDHVCHIECKETDSPLTTDGPDIPEEYMALDIGPKTIEKYQDIIRDCSTVIWNGPMGVFEINTYATGTFAIAKAMGDGTEKRGLLSIIGGGDSASAAEACGQASRMSHVSTGGGASLELLEGKILPGIAALDDKE